MSNGSISVDVSGELSIGTRPPAPKPPSFYIYSLGIFGALMGLATLYSWGKIFSGAISPEDLMEWVILTTGTGVITVVAFSIGTRTPQPKTPDEERQPSDG